MQNKVGKILTLGIILTGAACAKPEGSGNTVFSGPAGPAGPPGPQGEPGESSIIEVVPTCPGIPGNYPEVLWRLDGKLYAVYASGQKIHLTELTPGNYVTTDGRNCHFTVDNDLNII